MEMRKISVRVGDKLMGSFQAQLDALHVKRDAYLDHIISGEVVYLRAELAGKKLSRKGRRYIARDVMRTGKLFNLTIRKTTADALDSVVEESNMVRDAFLNRLIVMLRCGETLRSIWNVPRTMDGPVFRGTQGMPVSPLEAMEELRADPLYYLRTFMKEHHNEGLYTTAGLPPAFCCYLDDLAIPGTTAHIELMTDLLSPDEYEKKYLAPIHQSAP